MECESYVFLEVPLGFAVRFGEDALEDDLLVLAFFDGHVDQRFHETLLFLFSVQHSVENETKEKERWKREREKKK